MQLSIRKTESGYSVYLENGKKEVWMKHFDKYKDAEKWCDNYIEDFNNIKPDYADKETS